RRLARSAAALSFACDEEAARERLEAAVAAPAAPRLRVRLTLARDGRCMVSAAPVDAVAPATGWHVRPAGSSFDSREPLLPHQTAGRDLGGRELAARGAGGAEEVGSRNERDEICGGARANLFLAAGGMLLPPPLACGLLPGTLRESLLAQGRAREAVLRL